MLIWVTALHCEAKPIIDYYRLKKSSHCKAFDCYQNETMQCVVSGIGKPAMAAATGWIAAINQQQVPNCWINIGIAGAADRPIGDIFLLNKVTDSATNRPYYPVPGFSSELASAACISLDQPSSDYHRKSLFDMEASAFFAAATRFSTVELVHCLKVISDNQHQQTGYDKPAVSRLIHNQLETIDGFVQNLQDRTHEIY